MSVAIIEAGYGLAALAFLALFLLTALSKIRSRQRRILLVVSGINFLWALSLACSGMIAFPAWLLVVVELARIASWLFFAIDLMGLIEENTAKLLSLKTLCVALPAMLAVYILVRPALQTYPALNWLPKANALWLLFPIAGLLLLENLFRNAERDTRWALKHLCIAIGVIFTCDFFYFADALASGHSNPLGVRGFVNAMMVPLLAIGVVRSRSWPVAIHVSRQVIFHSFALVGSGLYLLTMAATSFYLRHIDANWGPPLQVVFFIGALSILAVIFTSGSIRARVMHFVSRNFFSLKYDYRQTWMRFVQALSSTNPELCLQRRLLDAVTDLMGSTGGGLWIRSHEDQAYIPSVSRNMGDALPAEPVGSPLANWLNQRATVIELAEAAEERRYPNLELPDWLRTLTRAWLVVPLFHRDLLQAFLVLAQPRSDRALDWEDHELLLAIGRQAASYIAEEQSAKALADTRHLQVLSRRFAFVAHDLKNIVGQLTLMLRNVKRFKEDAEFQEDMLETIVHSVERMNGLLQQLRSMGDDGAAEPLALDAMLAETAEAWQRDRPGFSADLKPVGGWLKAPRGRLRSVLDHLVQNAFDAAGSDGRVALSARNIGNSALIEVEDNGPGMELEFVRHKLFRPSVSTRPAGFGIGAYQIREYVRSMGGYLEVRTVPGKGTTMRVVLPLITLNQESATASASESVAS